MRNRTTFDLDLNPSAAVALEQAKALEEAMRDLGITSASLTEVAPTDFGSLAGEVWKDQTASAVATVDDVVSGYDFASAVSAFDSADLPGGYERRDFVMGLTSDRCVSSGRPETTEAQTPASIPVKRPRGRPITIPDEVKAEALALKKAGGSYRTAAMKLYGTGHPTAQQVKSAATILREYRKKRPRATESLPFGTE